jgi:hypothetical protein
VDHDDWRRVALLVHWYLELDVHLADRDLIRAGLLISGGNYGVVRNFRYTTDKETPLILDNQRFGQESPHLLPFLRGEISRQCK